MGIRSWLAGEDDGDSGGMSEFAMAAFRWDYCEFRALEFGDELANFARHRYSILILRRRKSSYGTK
jgi:hypothetical protein